MLTQCVLWALRTAKWGFRWADGVIPSVFFGPRRWLMSRWLLRLCSWHWASRRALARQRTRSGRALPSQPCPMLALIRAWNLVFLSSLTSTGRLPAFRASRAASGCFAFVAEHRRLPLPCDCFPRCSICLNGLFADTFHSAQVDCIH